MQNVEQIAAGYYRDLPYHNFQHVQNTAQRARDIIQACTAKVDREVVYFAILFHDAGYHEDHLARGFDSKEAYAASIAAHELAKLGKPAEFIEKVTAAIMATHREGQCRTIEDKVVRAADIANVGGDYQSFLLNTRLLKTEFEILTGKPISWEEWKNKTAAILEPYLQTDLSPADAELIVNGRRNLARFQDEADG